MKSVVWNFYSKSWLISRYPNHLISIFTFLICDFLHSILILNDRKRIFRSFHSLLSQNKFEVLVFTIMSYLTVKVKFILFENIPTQMSKFIEFTQHWAMNNPYIQIWSFLRNYSKEIPQVSNEVAEMVSIKVCINLLNKTVFRFECQ